jgi:hypothetical protein
MDSSVYIISIIYVHIYAHLFMECNSCQLLLFYFGFSMSLKLLVPAMYWNKQLQQVVKIETEHSPCAHITQQPYSFCLFVTFSVLN